MKTIKHIYKYLTSPTYRFWIDFCTQEEMINRQISVVEDNLRLKSYPIFRVQDDKIEKNMTPKTNNEWEKELFIVENGETYLKDGVGISEIKSCVQNLLFSERQRLKKEIQLAIAEETNIAHQENQPISRLTSLKG